LARAAAEQLEAFDRALELDPSFTPALIHPLEIAFRAADTAHTRRYVGYLRAVPASQAAAAEAYRRAAAALAGPADAGRLADALDHLLTTLDTAWSNLAWQAYAAAAVPLTRAAALLPAAQQEPVIARARQRFATDGSQYSAAPLVQMLVAGGR